MCSVVLDTLCTVQGTPYGAICSLQCSMICTQHDTVHIAQCFENYTAHCECAMYYVDWAAEDDFALSLNGANSASRRAREGSKKRKIIRI